jgi:hypothetical protein
MSEFKLPGWLDEMVLPQSHRIDCNYIYRRKTRNKQRADLSGTNKMHHNCKYMRWPHVESKHLYSHENDQN